MSKFFNNINLSLVVLLQFLTNSYVDISLLGSLIGIDRSNNYRNGGDTILGQLAKFLSRQCDALTKIQEDELMRKYDEELVRIHHYGGRQFVSYRVLDAPHLLLHSSTFNPLQMTVLFLHGYRNTPDEPYVEDIANNFYMRGINFLSYAANAYTSETYLKAVGTTPLLSRTLANFIMNMLDLGYPHDNIYLVGFSLGAQFAAQASRIIQRERGIMLPRITAIDPSTLCFSSPSSIKLTKYDAQYVDAIHTTILSFSDTEIGHADFYLNGENDMQPGCDTISCSHSRALLVYAESIMNDTAFMARECDNWRMYVNGYCNNRRTSFMGFSSPGNSRGKYYLRTNSYSPYGLGHIGVF